MLRTEIPVAIKAVRQPKTIVSFTFKGDENTKPTAIDECEHQWTLTTTFHDVLVRGMVTLRCENCEITGCAGMLAWFGWIPKDEQCQPK